MNRVRLLDWEGQEGAFDFGNGCPGRLFSWLEIGDTGVEDVPYS